MRFLVQKTCLEYFPPGSRILELNAGSGEDALFLAANGMIVHATDISEEMIKIIRKKIESGNLNEKITAEVLSFDEINKVTCGPFDGVFSNFGGLNCINDFSKLSPGLSSKLKTGGIFIAVVMNKFCLWEIFYYLLKLDTKNAFRRFRKNGIMAELNGEKVKTYYFSPGQFTEALSGNFEKIKISAMAFKTPPPYLKGFYMRFKPIVKFFMLIDELIMNIYPFNRLGDHFMIVMKKKGL
jgi:ubiquinone/menaquinone biosynthesis C-methylase UbiE